uniref:Uncharacterized protein n=1 Tax=Moniliophthora roreri TaxID=221103 RepID=A0A0W0FEM5_MONRR
MAGAARTKLSKTPQAINQMEVTSLTLVIIQALYSIGEQILAAFEDLCDSLKEMGNASSSTLRLMFLHKLDKALSNNLATFTEHADKLWFPVPYMKLLLTITPICDSFAKCFPTLSLPKSISSHIPDTDK